MSHWKISDFAKQLDKHNNTIDGWFRELELERRLHYISRVNDEKVYDELDLKIAKFIVEQRNKKWSLSAIFDDLANHFSLRPFPNDFENSSKSVQLVDVEKMRATFMNEMKNAFLELSDTQMKEIHNLLPSKEQERLDRINAIMGERKVVRMLEEEALELWIQKPEEERMVKVGWFRKEEDKDKRELFIKDYIDKHFETYLKKEFNV